MSSKKDFYSIKWEHYKDLYLRHFPKDPKCIIEIGVYKGGSLHWLKQTFPNATIVGIDRDPACQGAQAPGIRVFTGKQTDRLFLTKLLAEVPVPDVIIDDGGHRPYQQLASFKYLFPALAVDGVYCCEDLCECYLPWWKLWQVLFGGFMPHLNHLIDRMNQDPTVCIKSIHYYPWIAFLHKGCTPIKLVSTGSADCRLALSKEPL